MLTITILHSSPRSARYSAVVKNIIQKAGRKRSIEGEVAVSFITDAKMRKLNRTYRGKDKTTNVLSFETGATADHRLPTTGKRDLGDIFISYSVAKKEAKQYGWTMNYAIARLALHGFLHLLGYDHEKDKDAEVMEGIEKRMLQPLSLRGATRRRGNLLP